MYVVYHYIGELKGKNVVETTAPCLIASYSTLVLPVSLSLSLSFTHFYSFLYMFKVDDVTFTIIYSPEALESVVVVVGLLARDKREVKLEQISFFLFFFSLPLFISFYLNFASRPTLV